MDSTVVAIPVYFGTMGAEYWWLRRRAERQGGPSPSDYERRDTIASLTMGVGSLLAPMVVPKVFGPITPGKGRYGKALVATAAGAVAVTTIADVIGRLAADPGPTEGSSPTEGSPAGGAAGPRAVRRSRRERLGRLARRVSAIGGPAAIATGGIAITTTWASRTSMDRMWDRRLVRDLGRGPLAFAAAMVGWDFIYYWNHRFMHESRYMWAVHVVHHSSERYNLSTALRQPVLDALGTFVPYSVMALFGIRPSLIAQSRGLNLLYQYWIHTDAIRRLGPAEAVLNTPSHHRVHHGSNHQYLDRNHGGILISWDRLFGTFEREDEPVVYGLTRNIDTFSPVRIATHEHADMLRDVSRSRTWRERLSYVVRGPGWAYRRRDARAAAGSAPVDQANATLSTAASHT